MGNEKTRNSPRAHSDTVPGPANVAPRNDTDAYRDTKRVEVSPTSATDDASWQSSATAAGIAGTSQTDGAVELGRPSLPEATARQTIEQCFSNAGYRIASDYPFRHEQLMVRLDGFDPSRSTGYQYVSHQDQDVVSDFDPEVEKQIQNLSAAGVAHILVVHDYAATTREKLVEFADNFLARLKERG